MAEGWRGASRLATDPVPYSENEDLPASIRHRLPPHAQDIYREAFNHAWDEYGADEPLAHRVAWAAVKRAYVKDGDAWLPRAVSLSSA